MNERARWFNRKFQLDLPASMYPSVVERVRAVPARLEELLRNVLREILTRRDGEAWSAQEHAGHLLDLEPLGLARLADFRSGAQVLTAADLQNRRTHEADHNSCQLDEILSAFRAERAEFVRRLEEFDEASMQHSALHPRLNQPMRVIDLAYFVAEHDDHHLAAITELISRLTQPATNTEDDKLANHESD